MAAPAVDELAKSDPDVEIIWRSFELRPEPVPTLDPNGEYIQRAWQQSVLPLAEQVGVEMVLPSVQPRSRLAHEAAHWARSHGKGDEYHSAVFDAFYGRGENIGEAAVLIEVAKDLGMDGDELQKSLERHEFLEAVLDDVRVAHELGISGVPAFVADRKAALSGVNSAEALRRLVESVRK